MLIDFYTIGNRAIGPTAWLLNNAKNTPYMELSDSDRDLIRETIKKHGMKVSTLIELRGMTKDKITVRDLITAIGIWKCKGT